jgi:hypothetical protein
MVGFNDAETPGLVVQHLTLCMIFFGTWQSLTLASPFGPPGHYYEDNKAKAVVVVTHGLAMRLILMQLFHWSPNTIHTVWSLCLV